MINYTITILLGSVTIFGIVIKNEHVLFLTMCTIMATCFVVMLQILWRCHLRNKRLKEIDIRKSAKCRAGEE